MTCSELVELITAYLEGALDEVSEMQAVGHLDRCPSCRFMLDQHRQTIRLLGSAVPPTPLPPVRHTALLAAFHEWHR